MSKQFSGVRSIYITPADTSIPEIVLLDQLSTDTTITQEVIEVESTTGAKYGGQTWTLEATSFKSNNQATIDQLKAWSETDTRVIMAIELVDGVLLWNQPTNVGQFQMNFAMNARDGLNKIYMKAQSIGAYPHVIHAKNIIKAIAKYPTTKRVETGVYTPINEITAWAPDKWDNGGTYQGRGGGASVNAVQVFWPFVGADLTVSENSGNDVGREIQVSYLDVNQNQNGQDSMMFNTGTAGDRLSFNTITPVGTKYIVVSLFGNTPFTEIAIRNDGSKNFINY